MIVNSRFSADGSSAPSHSLAPVSVHAAVRVSQCAVTVLPRSLSFNLSENSLKRFQPGLEREKLTCDDSFSLNELQLSELFILTNSTNVIVPPQ